MLNDFSWKGSVSVSHFRYPAAVYIRMIIAKSIAPHTNDLVLFESNVFAPVVSIVINKHATSYERPIDTNYIQGLR